MRLKITITPEGPELSEIERQLNKMKPPLNSRVVDNLMKHASIIREKINFNIINETGTSYTQTQTLSDSNHSITITGRMFKETLIEKIKKFF